MANADGSAYPLDTNMTDIITSEKFAAGIIPAGPRLRMNKSTSLTLTTTWATLDFDGASPYNLNSFAIPPGETLPAISWDATNKLFKFVGSSKNYTLFLTTSVSSTSILGVLGVAVANLRVRLVVPRPAGNGGPIYFPGPDLGGYIDGAPVNLVNSPRNDVNTLALFSEINVRTYGVQVQVALSNNQGAGTIILNGADLNVFAA